MRAELRVAHVGGGQAGQRRIFRAFGHHVDAAADASGGTCAVGEGAGTLEHFHTLDHLQRHTGGRGQPEQAVHADISVRDVEAANLEVVTVAAACRQCADGGIVHDHVGDRQGLLVLDQFRRVVGGAERHVHQVGDSQDAQVSATGELAARVGFLKPADGFGLIGHDDFLKRCPCRCLGSRAGSDKNQPGAEALANSKRKKRRSEMGTVVRKAGSRVRHKVNQGKSGKKIRMTTIRILVSTFLLS